MSAVEKPKRRNSEKRKEKSRDAARCRRNQETGIFYELAHELPISYTLLSQLDKASVIRLSITHLKLRQLLANACLNEYPDEQLVSADIEQRLDQQYYKCLDGFLIVVTRSGDIIYISDNVEKYLGLTQVDMLGHSVTDFAHPCDHDELHDLISGRSLLSSPGTDDSVLSRQRALFVRMKCTLTSKGRNINIKSAAFKVIHYSGKLMRLDNRCDNDLSSCTVLIGRPVPGLATLELALDRRTFVSRHGLDLRFVYCDDEAVDLVGYSCNDLMGKSLLSYHHAFDAELVDKAYKSLFAKGQTITGIYRFLAKYGGYVWMETRATVIGDSQMDKARSVICINHVISDIECADVILADVQLPQVSDTAACRQLALHCMVPNAADVGSKRTVDDKNTNSLVIEEEEISIVCDDNEDDDDDTETSSPGMQFITEKLVSGKPGATYSLVPHAALVKSPMLSATSIQTRQREQLTSASTDLHQHLLTSASAAALHAVGSSSSLDNILDDLDCGMEMRAPYIPMDDMIFASSIASEASSPTHSSVSSPIDLTTCSSNTIDVDAMNALFSCSRPIVHSSESTGPHSKRPLGDHVFNLILPTSKILRLNVESADSDKNHLECTEASNQLTTSVSGSSVLLNLLTTGVDTNWGYRLRDTADNHPNEHTATTGDAVTPVNMALTALLRHLLNPSSPGNCTGMPANTGGTADAGVNCISGAPDILFHVTQLPSSSK
jgi:PAS domain S-box-containing protein